MYHYRWTLFALAWISLIISLPAPGLTADFLIMNHTPVALFIFFSIAKLEREPWNPFCLMLLGGVLAFLTSPICLFGGRNVVIGLALKIWSLLLLAPWAFLVVAVGQRNPPSAFGWGYFLYASAHSVMLLACLSFPGRGSQRRKDRSRGFPVVTKG